MGAASSKIYTTDWEKADGHLKHNYETLDRSPPFKNHHSLVLQHNEHSQRDIIVKDENFEILYSTRAVPGTAFWFDVCKFGGEPILQVRGHPWGNIWDIYAYNVPTIVGQKSLDDDENSHLYLKARLFLNWKSNQGEVKKLLPREGGSRWSKPILVYNEINYVKGQGQTHLPDNNDLVSYFQRKSAKEIQLEVAKGSDVALHIILTCVANLVHANTNPFIVHAYQDTMF